VPDAFGNWPIDESQERLCSYPNSGLNQGWYTCKAGTTCGAPDDYNLPLSIDDMSEQTFNNFGLTTFDNIYYAFWTILNIITMEGWTAIMYLVSTFSS